MCQSAVPRAWFLDRSHDFGSEACTVLADLAQSRANGCGAGRCHVASLTRTARCGPRSPRRGRARARRSAGRVPGRPLPTGDRASRPTAGADLEHRGPASGDVADLDSHRVDVAAVRVVHVPDDLRPVPATAPRPLSQLLGGGSGDAVEHGPGRLDDRRQPIRFGRIDWSTVLVPDRARHPERRRRVAGLALDRLDLDAVGIERQSGVLRHDGIPRARPRGTPRPPAPPSSPASTSPASPAPKRRPSCRRPRLSPEPGLPCPEYAKTQVRTCQRSQRTTRSRISSIAPGVNDVTSMTRNTSTSSVPGYQPCR